MPPLPSPGSVLRVEFQINTESSVLAGSRFFISYTGGPPNTTDLNTLAGDVASGWNTELAARTSTSDTLEAVTIRDLSSDTGAIGTWTGSHAGTDSNPPHPASICAVVNHTISRSYRGGRPRTYLRCGTTADNAGQNEWSDSFQSELLTAWQAFISALLGTTGLSIALTNIVNVSYYNGFTVFTSPSGRARNIPTPRTSPVVGAITNSAVAKKLGSQRRRLNV